MPPVAQAAAHAVARTLPHAGHRRLASWLAAALAAWLAAAPGARANDELTNLPLEHLLQTEVTSAASFARQVTDAASAVSVLTAEEIRIYGLRTLSEILDHMRGIHISHTLDYAFIGARGAGGDVIASRVLTLVDGNPPPDNLYDQLYLGRDALVDVAMIERVEYAPGTGSALYGNNALLGVINVVTKRGRDLDGAQVSAGAGDWGQRTWRVSAGQRQTNGLEWLASYTLHHDNGLPSPDIGALTSHHGGRSETALLKAQWEGFSALLMTAQRRVTRDYLFRPADGDAWFDAAIDRNEMLAIGHDSRPSEHWRLSLKAQHGRYAYRVNSRWRDGDTDETVNDGRWSAVNAQAGYDGWQRHRVALGLRVRHDPVQDFYARYYDGEVSTWRTQGRSFGLSLEDQLTLDDQWALTAGLRADRREGAPWTWSPRLAAVWQVSPDWSLKASTGRASLHPSAVESMPDDDAPALTRDATITATTSELVSEYRQGGLRVLGSLYRFTTRNPGEDVTFISAGGRGAELEVEWQARGWRLRGSQAWQDADPGAGQVLYYSPRHLTKLQLSAPLAGEALRLSATARHVGAYRVEGLGPVPSRTLLDLTLVSQKALPGLDVRIGWRNLLQRRDREAEAYRLVDEGAYATRSAWIELTGTFR
jgi:outer membrane receptor protein involved in Fe transport